VILESACDCEECLNELFFDQSAIVLGIVQFFTAVLVYYWTTVRHVAGYVEGLLDGVTAWVDS